MIGLRRRKNDHRAPTRESVALEHLRALARSSLALAAVADQRIDDYIEEKKRSNGTGTA